MKIKMHGISDIGCVRKNNEDSVYFDEALGISVVCDGIGGREGGEIASQIATESMNEALQVWRRKVSDPTQFLKTAAQNINARIIKKGLENKKLEGMGTTMESSLFLNGTLYLAHIGDSRTYLSFKNHFWQITIDHNVKTLMEYGDLPPEMAKHASGDALVKALGVSPQAEVDVYQMTLEPGQIFLSASDGLFDMVEDKRIAEIVKAHLSNSETMIQELVAEACKNGGVDNISIVVTRVG